MRTVPFIACTLLSPLFLLACGSANRPPRVGPPPARPEARSSIAAVLKHKEELGLSVEQVRRLEELDDKLAGDNAMIRVKLRQPSPTDKRGRSGPDKGGGAGSGSGGPIGGGGPGGGFGPGGGMGGGGPGRGGLGPGGGMGGGGPMGGGLGRGPGGAGRRPGGEPGDTDGSDRAGHIRKAIQQMDDNDTAAYLEAEKVFTEAQRERAREVASRHREQLWEWREAMADRDTPLGDSKGTPPSR